MLETGQPIHMYDYDKLNKKEFIKTGFDCKEVIQMVRNIKLNQLTLLYPLMLNWLYCWSYGC